MTSADIERFRDPNYQLRVGVIGTGGMGTFHARTLASMRGVDLVWVADPVPTQAAPLIDEFGCRYEANPMDAALDGSLDGVVIASPDATHAELTLAAAGVGTWVLCEKPLATTGADALRIVDATSHLPGAIQVGFMREFDPAHIQLVELRDSIGEVVFARLVHRNANDVPPPVSRAVTQSMVHDIHSIRFLSGREIVSVRGYASGPAGDGYRHLLAVCELTGGVHATIEFDGAGFAYEVGVELLGTRADAVTGAPTRAVLRRDGDAGTHVGADWFGRFATAYRLQDEAWVESIRSGVPTGPTAADGLAAQLVADAILASLASGASVSVANPESVRDGVTSR